MIKKTGYERYSIWEHSENVQALYTRRCRREEPEMDCAAQALEILSPLLKPNESILDVGCGSGYFFHSFAQRKIPVQYIGIDASPTLIEIGRRELAPFGLARDALHLLRLEDADGECDHVVCMNVLSNMDNYHKPLDRMLRMAKKTLLLRESLHNKHAGYSFVLDKYLESPDSLRVHVNTYREDEIVGYIESYGFRVTVFEDKRSKGKPELVIDHPHYWKFLLAQKV